VTLGKVLEFASQGYSFDESTPEKAMHAKF